MGSLKLPHSGGNSMSLAAPATNPASDLELKLPSTVGSAGQVLKNSDTAGTLEFGPPPRPYRNLVVNGSCLISQRSTSSTSTGYQTVDRFKFETGGNDEAPTQAQVDVASGTTPFTEGFRKALKITNGNQTSGAGAGDRIIINYFIEAQDIANSGWNYTSASSYITLSFWVKSSVAQVFYVRLESKDGTRSSYPLSTGSLSADTWTKVTHSVPGHSSLLQFDNDTATGLQIEFTLYRGTNNTSNSVTLNAWGAYDTDERVPDVTTTWFTTNDATFEITGVQLEVGDTATEFEHRSYADELARCQRYYWQETGITFFLYQYNSSHKQIRIKHPVQMRTTPTETLTGSGITADAETNQFYSAYAASAYDGSNFFYSAVKFSAEL